MRRAAQALFGIPNNPSLFRDRLKLTWCAAFFLMNLSVPVRVNCHLALESCFLDRNLQNRIWNSLD